MELVGGVASIITLIEATGVLARVSRDLVLRWRNAPHEIQALATRLSLLAAELQSIKSAAARSHPVLTDAIIRQSLSDLLTDVRKRLAKLETLQFRLQQHGVMRQKVEWASKAGSVEKMLSKTQEVEQRLANLMTLISLRAQTPILEGLDRIEQMVSTLVIALPASASVAPATPSFFAAASNKRTPVSRSGAAVRRTFTSKPWLLAESWKPWGLRGSFVASKKGLKYEYNINFSVSLPLARILGGYAFTGCLSLESVPLFGTALTFRHPSYFAVARVVDESDPFMEACCLGDVETVRTMLRSGEGRPTDVTADGWTPMGYAVCAGDTKVIAELLDCGVDVDAITHSDMSNALTRASEMKCLDIVRFLLQRGASADHVDSHGFAAGTCWFTGDDETRYSSTDIFNLLTENSHIDVNDDTQLQFPLLFIAASYACGAQIDALVRLGADVHLRTASGAAVVSHAAWCGNYSTYSALASYYSGDVFNTNTELASQLLLNTLYGRQYLLDGMSVLVGDGCRSPEYDKIMIDMFHRGVGPRTRLDVADSILYYTPHGVHHEDYAANELAAAMGPETEAWYLSILCICGLLAHGEIQRLCELAEAGHVPDEFGCELESKLDELEYGVRGDCEDLDRTPDIRQEGTYGDIDGVSRRSSTSEADEANQFWDAEEVI